MFLCFCYILKFYTISFLLVLSNSLDLMQEFNTILKKNTELLITTDNYERLKLLKRVTLCPLYYLKIKREKWKSTAPKCYRILEQEKVISEITKEIGIKSVV